MVLQIEIRVMTVPDYTNWVGPQPTRDAFIFRWARYWGHYFLPVPYTSVLGVT